MDHGPATEWKTDKAESFKSRLGLIMFAIYFPIYITFILISVISPRTMGMDVGSLNLAIVFGLGLIVLAIVQAFVYNSICSRREKHHEELERREGELAK